MSSMPLIGQRLLRRGKFKKKTVHIPGWDMLSRSVPVHINEDGDVVIKDVVVQQRQERGDPRWRTVDLNGVTVDLYVPTIKVKRVTHIRIGPRGPIYCTIN